MTDATLPPDQFLYGRKGPWPQPSPSHPLIEAYEVLNIPPIETLLWNATIGERLLKTQVGYPPMAAGRAAKNIETTTPTDAEFATMMFTTSYQRYLQPISVEDSELLERENIRFGGGGQTFKYDFRAMGLVEPLAGMYCAGTQIFISGSPAGKLVVEGIRVNGMMVTPANQAWGLAKIYALQGAAYHMLFVVHPALHFPMDSVNAITKTAVPHTHLLFQLLYPHTSYTLALDNAVLEGPESVVNENARGSWFDPLTGNAYNLKLLFAAGYAGVPDQPYSDSYPAYDYMRPQLLKLKDSPPSPVFDTPYSRWLTAYYERAFLPFCEAVAFAILEADPKDSYVTRWARYLNQCVRGFPDEKQILDLKCLAQALAIYMWDVTVSHGADHYSFAMNVPPVYKYLRIRRAPPTSPNDPPVTPGQIFTGDDLYRSEMAQAMFFMPSAIPPNLDQTYYAFTSPLLWLVQEGFHNNLDSVSTDKTLTQYMPLKAVEPPPPLEPGPPEVPYALTIPASIQF
ncbi:hypothetical protein ACIPRI_03710 [Variovorax sp. LARHSF232]